MLGFEDEIVIGLVINSLSDKALDPKQLQLDITGFLEKQTPKFVEELWTLLVEAQANKHGIPQQFVDSKKQQLVGAGAAPASKPIKYLGAASMAPPVPSDVGAAVEQAKATAAAAAALSAAG